jgi:hypothetical protein
LPGCPKATSVTSTPSLEHNGFVDLFRENPSLAPHFLAMLFHLEVPPYASVAVVESALDPVFPAYLRADLVLELRDASGATVLAIVLEIQSRKEPEKKDSWLFHVAAVRARRRCSAVVLVVAPDAEVAAWAEAPIDIGAARGSILPLVLGPATIPVVTDEALAEREAELTILSALAHGNGPNGLAIVQALRKALGRFDQERAAVYFQLIHTTLREPMRKALEALPVARRAKVRATFPAFIQRLIDDGRLEGQLESMRSVVLRLAARAGVSLGEDEVARVESCADLATLGRWVDNVVGAKTAADVLS